MKKTISIVTPTFNEVQNIEKLCFEISEIMDKSDFNYEHIVIDNNSSDGTIEKLRNISKKNKNLKVIITLKILVIYDLPFMELCNQMVTQQF